MKKILAILFSFAVAVSFSYENVLADGIIIPDPPICDPCPIPHPMTQLSIRYHHVSVSIKDQIATTYVDQVFYNPNDWEVEGDYIFPIPIGATIDNFILWFDDSPVEGKILEADDARQTYEQIVSTLRDPALLEYADQGAVRARIFPIPAKSERRIEIQYSQILTAENGLVHYLYPLSTEKFSVDPLRSVSITVKIESSQPIRAVYSPSHKVSISRESDTSVSAGYEEQDVLPDQDFSLFYSTGDSQAFHMLTFRDPSELDDPDGYFLLLLAPALQESVHPIPKDVLVVVDQSGSMEGEKFEQVQQALRYILSHLNQEDRFNIIPFSTGVDFFAQNLIPASERDQAISWVGHLTAGGSTDINRALLESAALIEDDRPVYIIFLTDGLPTVGEVEAEKIISNLQNLAPKNMNIFVFGVGYDVDTFLLDSLAHNHHGTSIYVLPGEALDETLSEFYNKISSPVLTNLELDFGNLQANDIYPYPLPDLFVDGQIAVVGRYSHGGITNVTLRGESNGVVKEFIYPHLEFAKQSTHREQAESKIPILWATRKIGYLLQQIRLNGADREIIDEIVQLSIRFGIVTPYTSYLVTEPSILGVEERERVVTEELQKFNDLAQLPTFGRDAVEQAEGQNSLASAEAVPVVPQSVQAKVRIVDMHTFVDTEGIWVDTRYDPQQMEPITVEFLSEQYFSLAWTDPGLAQAFALGPEVIVVSGDVVYEIKNKLPGDASIPDPDPGTNLKTTPHPTGSSDFQEQTSSPESPATSHIPCLNGLVISIVPIILLSFSIRWRQSKSAD